MTTPIRKLMTIIGAILALSFTACGGPMEEQETTQDELEAIGAAATCPVSVGRELMVTALSVVNDPVRTRWTGGLTNKSDGAWQFGRLMTAMAGTKNPSDFVLAWLNQWSASRTVNGEVVPARTAISSVINSWPKLPNGKLDLTKAPLRLLAIVDRLDLRNLAAGKAGEGRFVFGVLDSAGNPLQFTVILEYNLPGSTQADVNTWAARWHALGTLALGTPAYNAALQAITDGFAGPNLVPSKPNGSSISQVRSNEIALSFPWQLREFGLNANGNLVERTVAQTPQGTLDGSTKIRDFVNQNQAAILAGTFTVPLSFEGAPFRAGAILNNIDFWSAPGITNNNARQQFSLNTCNGCHGAETQTAFLQISPRLPGSAAALSGFLRGETVSDPVSGVARKFNDLARRANDLRTLVCPAAPALTTLSADDVLGARVH
ncbi:MAG: hypothetical protein U1E65_17655 [Myxococcota bacterium]